MPCHLDCFNNDWFSFFRHEFHKMCIDPWLVEHRTCPMCKLNILKELGVVSLIVLYYLSVKELFFLYRVGTQSVSSETFPFCFILFSFFMFSFLPF